MTSGSVYRVGPFLAVAGLIAALAGCGRNAFFQEQRAAWRGEAEAQCMRSGAVKRSQFIQPIGAVNGPGTCGMDQGLRVTALASGTVSTVSRQTLGCPMVAGLDRWLEDIVQPAAQATYGAAVVEMKSGSYACRGRNGQPGAKISEHGFGNGADIFSFRFTDGREVTVKNGWRGAADEQHFLRTVFVGACKQFRTVLGPGADAFHYDHFHLDLAMHDPRGVRTVCKPVLKFDPVPYDGIIDREGPQSASLRRPAVPAPVYAGAVPPRPPQTFNPRPVYAQPAQPPFPRVPVAQAARPAAIGAPLALHGRSPLDSTDEPEDDPLAAND